LPSVTGCSRKSSRSRTPPRPGSGCSLQGRWDGAGRVSGMGRLATRDACGLPRHSCSDVAPVTDVGPHPDRGGDGGGAQRGGSGCPAGKPGRERSQS
jgi:hypothetical protein